MLRRRGEPNACAFRCATLAAALGLTACVTNATPEVLPPIVMGLAPTTPASYDDGARPVYHVTSEVVLPYKAAASSDRVVTVREWELSPYPRKPEHRATETRVTLKFTLSNLDALPRQVDVLIDPWNEFVRYRPGLRLRADRINPGVSGYQRTFDLPPLGRISGEISPEDVVEMAVDLTTAMTIHRFSPSSREGLSQAELFDRTFSLGSRSTSPKPELARWVPPLRSRTAAMIGFDVGLRSTEPVAVGLELNVDIEDPEANRLVRAQQGGRIAERPTETLSP